ncbi:MAG: glycosyltransferase family 2 protein [Candidatus Magasanikbacteria bacterium]|nr:glycosyltransferase family 2 protein [Candidatus Magasanikbacteria bacterium]
MFLAIVPAYNEEKRISSVIQSLFQCVDEIVVVDDCSTDKTAEVAKKAGARVLRHKINLGQGAALETGHVYARERGAEFILHFDGDGQLSVEDISPAFEQLKTSGADIILGSRFLDTRSQVPWFKRTVLLPVGVLINKFFTGLKLTDAHNGFRILNARALDKIRITQDRMAHATEIISLIKKYNLKHVEFPVKVVYHEYGQRSMAGFRILKDLVFGKFMK